MAINGPEIGATLLEARKRLEDRITKERHLEELDEIFESTSDADKIITMIWDHPFISTFHGKCNRLAFYENYIETGSFLAEYGGGWWREGHGFLGEWNNRERVGWESG